MQMAFGAVIENMLQAATANALSTDDWELRYREDAEGHFLVIPAYASVPESLQVPEWILGRHTHRGKYACTPVAADVVAELDGYTEGGLGLQIYLETASIRSLGRLVGQASEIRFQTEAVHRWLDASLRFTATEAARGDGLDVKTLALPPGGEQLLAFISDWGRMRMLNRFHAYKLLAAVEKQQFAQCGAVLAITGRESGELRDWVSAGRLMERAWLRLNRQGLSVHPYFVLPDTFYRLKTGLVPEGLREKAGDIVSAARAFLHSTELMPYMLLRVGAAKKPAKLSRRLPLDAVLMNQGDLRGKARAGEE